MPQEPIGLIGAGLLGSALAERFVGAGYRVLGFDSAPERRAALRESGGEPAACAGDVAASSRCVVLSLPHSGIVSSVLDEIVPRLPRDALVVDTTTGDPVQSVGFHQRLEAAGAHYLEAAVGGSSRQVRACEAIVIAGGRLEDFDSCADLFACFATRTFHAGPSGHGARMKLVLNLVLGLNRAVLAEGLAFAEAYGLRPAEALEILKAGPAYSRVMDTKGAKMLARDFTPEARLSQHLKDVRLILAAGGGCGARLPLSTLHAELLAALESEGMGGLDNSAVLKYFL